jgi:hypothetical protein
MSQRALILSHLKRGDTLTPMDALKFWGCMRLAARIEELRDMGHPIQTEWVERGGKRYARYRLVLRKKSAA